MPPRACFSRARTQGPRARAYLAAAIAAALTVAHSAAPGARAVAPPPNDSRIEVAPAFEAIMDRAPGSFLRSVAGDGSNGINALWGVHRAASFYIEEQRHGEEAVLAGLAHHRPAIWRAGLREIDWGFAREASDGSFPGTGDPFHSTSFFVEGVAHLMLVLRGANADGIALPRGLRAHLDAHLAQLRAAARWMARPVVWTAGLASDAPYAHRRFLVAAAVGLTGVLTGDRTLRARAHQALAEGIADQRRDGVEPELGGSDSSYQARGLVYAEQFLAWLPHDSLAVRLRRTIGLGLAWERARILPSGEVSTAGNTRANGVMVDHNGPKRAVYPMVARALAWWALAGGPSSYLRVAARVQAWARSHPREVGI